MLLREPNLKSQSHPWRRLSRLGCSRHVLLTPWTAQELRLLTAETRFLTFKISATSVKVERDGVLVEERDSIISESTVLPRLSSGGSKALDVLYNFAKVTIAAKVCFYHASYKNPCLEPPRELYEASYLTNF